MRLEEDRNDIFTVVPHIDRNEVNASDFLIFLKNEVGSSVMHEFLGYFPSKEEDDVVELTILKIHRIKAWIVTVFELKIIGLKRADGIQNAFITRNDSNINFSSENLIG